VIGTFKETTRAICFPPANASDEIEFHVLDLPEGTSHARITDQHRMRGRDRNPSNSSARARISPPQKRVYEQHRIRIPDRALESSRSRSCPDRYPKFRLDESGAYFSNTVYFIGSDSKLLLGLLNSKLLWFVIRGLSNALRGGLWRFRLFSGHVERLPMPQQKSSRSDKSRYDPNSKTR